MDRTPGFPLDDRNPIADHAADHEVGDPQPYEIAAPELAVDREVEDSEIAQVPRKFETRSDGPNLLWLKRPLLADKTPALSLFTSVLIHGMRSDVEGLFIYPDGMSDASQVTIS